MEDGSGMGRLYWFVKGDVLNFSDRYFAIEDVFDDPDFFLRGFLNEFDLLVLVFKNLRCHLIIISWKSSAKIPS